MAAPVRFLSGRQQQQKIGIEGSTQNEKVLEVVGRVGIGTTIFEPSKELDVRGDVIVSGELTVGDTTFGTDVTTRNLSASGITTLGTVEVSSGIITAVSGVVTYYGDGSQLTNLPSSGLNEIREEGSVVGSSIESLNFVGNNITVSAAGTASTITSSDTPTFNTLAVSGVSTFTGAIDANGSLDVDGHTELDDVNVSGVSTFTGAIDANGSLDVDGHTELDDVNVSGAITATTFTGNLAGTVNTAAQPNITSLGTLTELGVTGITSSSAFADFDYLQAPFGSTVTFTVAVVSKDSSHRYNGTGSGFGYSINGVQAPFLTLTPGRTYRFTNDNTGSHPLKFYLEADKTTEYTSGVSFQNTYTEIVVSDQTPTVLHYQCTAHNYMGNAIQVNSNVVNTNYAATLRGGLDVTGHTELDSINVSGVSTFAGAADFNGNVDIDGHTELDNLNVSGVSTFVGLVTVTTGDVHIANRLFVGGLEVEGSGSENTFTGINTFTNLLDNTLGDPDTGALNVNGGFGVNKNASFGSTVFVQNAIGIGSTAPIGKLDVNGHTELDDVNVSGAITATTFTGNLAGTVNTASQPNITSLGTLSSLTVSGTIDANGNLDVDGQTELDDLNVSGVSTFQSDVHLGDNDILTIGTGDDLKIYHNANNSFVSHIGTGDLNITGDDVIIASAGFENKAKFITDGAVELYYDNSKKFETTGIGVSIVGTGNTATITGPSNLIIDPAAVGDNTGAVRIKGDLFVDGTQTQINSTTIELADFIVGIASTATTDTLADGAGIQIGPDNTFLYEYNGGTNPSLKSSENLNVASGKGYQINQTEVLSATTLGSSVVNSSLTSVGTLGSLTVSGNITANGNIVGDNSTNITGIDGVTATTLTGTPANTNSNSAFSVTANGSSAYRFTGPGNSGSDDNPDLYLVRGQRYTFTNNSGGSHPFQIRESSGGSAYNDGVTNNGASSGNIVFNVQHDAPARLYYQCTSHGGMVGTIYIVGGQQIISGIVTATTFSGSGASLTALNASNLASGTIPDGRFPSTLPAVSGANLTNLPAATTIPVADESSDTTCFPIFTTAATGSLALKSGSNLTFNSANGTLTATAFSGDGSALTNLSGVIPDVVSDTSPQLGGDLDVNGNDITGTGNVNLTGIITATTFSGSGASLDTLNASNLASGTIPDGRFPSTLPAISGASLTAVDAATLDGVDSTSFLRSDAADVKTSGNLTFNDNIQARFGSSADLLIFHNGNSFISNASTGGNLNLQSYSDSDVAIRADNGSGGFGLADYVRADGSTGEVVLSHYGNQKLATKSTGIDVTGHTETDTLNVSGISTFQDNIVLTGVGKSIQIGPTNDQLSLEHDANGVGLIRQNTELFLLSPSTQIGNLDSTKISATFLPTGGVMLKYNNNDRLQTTTGGVNVTGILTASTFSGSGASLTAVDAATLDGVDSTSFLRSDAADIKTSGNLTFNDDIQANFGTGDDLQIYHNGTQSRISHEGTGDLVLRNLTDNADVIIQSDNGSGSSTEYFRAQGSTGESILYHYGSQKLATKSGGVTVTGTLTATAFSGDGSALTNLPAGATPDKISEGNTEVEVIDTGSDGHVKFTTEGSERARIDASGRLGIGVTTPGSTLEINVGTATSAFDIQGSAGQLFSVTNNLTSGSIFSVNDVSGIPSIDVDADGTIQLAPFSATENVGVGTTNPTSKLHVVGDTRLTGITTLQGNIYVPSDTYLRLGDSNTLTLSQTSSVNTIQSSSIHGIQFQTQKIVLKNQTDNETLAEFTQNGSVDLYYDNSKKFETTSGGATVTGTLTATAFSGDGSALTGISADVVDDTTPQLGGDLNTNGNLIQFPDSGSSSANRVTFGDASDLSIYHDGSNSYISDTGTGNLLIRAESLVAIQDTSGNNSAIFNDGGTVELYHNNSLKFTTQSYGIDVTGEVQCDSLDVDGNADISGILNLGNNLDMPDNQKIILGTGDDLQLYHDGTTNIIRTAGNQNLQLYSLGTGAVEIASDAPKLIFNDATGGSQIDFSINANTGVFTMEDDTNSDTFFKYTQNGAVELYHNNSKKLETTDGGVTVTGIVTATSFEGDGSALTGIEAGGSPEFYTGITSSVQISPLSFETAVHTFPSTSGRQYVIESISVANVDESVGVGTTVNIIASIEDATAAEQTYIAYNVPMVTGGMVDLLKNPIVAGPSDVIKMWTTNDGYIGVNNAADVYINYTEFESTDYISKFASSTTINSTGAVTLYTSTGNPTMIEKIGFANRTDIGDFPVSIKITNGVTTSYLAKNLIIPRYSTVDILDRHKRIETGAKIEVEVGSTGTIDVIISGKKITS